jgi:LysR family transcriptional regulator, regulator for bpeEF and oprC
MDKFKSLVIFMETAKSESFADAARRLDLSSSAVSKAISRLESSIQVKLFQRSSRSLQLTTAGRDYYNRHCQLFKQIAEIDESIRDTHTDLSGALRIRLAPGFSQIYIIPQLTQFRQEFPKIQLNISFGSHIADLVRDKIDLMLFTGNLSDSRFIRQPIGCFQKITCAAPDYLQRYSTPQNIENLCRHQCLFLVDCDTQQIQSWQFKDNGRNVPYENTPSMTFDRIESIVQAAISGCGIVQAPSYLVQPAIDQGQLVPILQSFMSESILSLSLIYPARIHQSKSLMVWIKFIEAIADSLKQTNILLA